MSAETMRETEDDIPVETAAEVMDAEGRELVPVAKAESAIVPYQGASMLQITPEEAAILEAPRDENTEIDILPTGEIYLSQVHYRKTLNKAFGAGQWAMIPRSGFLIENNVMTREYALYVRGHFVAEAVGEQEYFPQREDSNKMSMSKATAAESLKSNAIMRVCKDLVIASECWDKRFQERFKREKCVQVWRKDAKGGPQWRRKDADPFRDETGIAQPRAAGTTPQAQPAPQASRTAPQDQPARAKEQAAPQGDLPAPDKWTNDKIPDDAQSATDKVMDLQNKKYKDKKTGEDRDRFIVTFYHCGDLTVFSRTAANVANKAMKSGAMCDIRFTVKQNGNFTNKDLQEIVIGEVAPIDAAASEPVADNDGGKHDDLPF